MNHTPTILPPIPASMAEEATILLAQGKQMTRSFADVLREYRRAAGLTQEELAGRSGISPRALRKLESGTSRAPRRDTMCLLAQALNLGGPERVLLQASVRRLPPAHTQLPRTPYSPIDPQMEAESLLDLTFHLARLVPMPYAEATALLVHGDLLAARGDWEEARARHEAALVILSHLGKRLIAGGVERPLERTNRS